MCKIRELESVVIFSRKSTTINNPDAILKILVIDNNNFMNIHVYHELYIMRGFRAITFRLSHRRNVITLKLLKVHKCNAGSN